ncbi:MAG: cytochrome c [Planctomycetes bacterium]|nr:cytochrome c [Planctomycetota bacterium]
MADQQKAEPFERSGFFADGMASRPLPPGTVARGRLRVDDHFFDGTVNGEPAETFPERVTSEYTPEALLARGRERFEIFCSHCHGSIGGGREGSPHMRELTGMVVKAGFPMPPTYHTDRLRAAPIGHFYDVITNGFGRMPSHASQIPPEDRWAIAAWVRALQASQHTALSELTEEEHAFLESPTDTDAP